MHTIRFTFRSSEVIFFNTSANNPLNSIVWSFVANNDMILFIASFTSREFLEFKRRINASGSIDFEYCVYDDSPILELATAAAPKVRSLADCSAEVIRWIESTITKGLIKSQFFLQRQFHSLLLLVSISSTVSPRFLTLYCHTKPLFSPC